MSKNIAFDIDDTLWKIVPDYSPTEHGSSAEPRTRFKQVPDYDLINVLKWFYENGDAVYVWSAGGTDYAQTIVNKLGIDRMVKVIPKKGSYGTTCDVDIDIAFDDAETDLGKVDVRIKRTHNCLQCGGDLTKTDECTC